MTDPIGPADVAPAGAGSAAASASAGDGARRRPRWRRGLAEMIVAVLAAALVTGLLRTFVFQVFWIPSVSMTPTLTEGDRIVVDKAFFSPQDVHEGDIVVFAHPPLDHCGGSPGDDLVKRVIALPGQAIYSAGGTIYVNGRPLAEPYLPPVDPLGPPIPNASSQHPYRVPPGEFYVLGDNRSDSCDSRFWGPIEGSSIVGKVSLVLWRNNHPDVHGV